MLKAHATDFRLSFERRAVEGITQDIEEIYQRMNRRFDDMSADNLQLREEQALLMVRVQVDEKRHRNWT